MRQTCDDMGRIASREGRETVCLRGFAGLRSWAIRGPKTLGERRDMTHLWVRAEQRPNEERVGLTPEGAAALVKAGIRVTVEESPRSAPSRSTATARRAARLRAENLWPKAPADAIIFGLKELPEDGTPLTHRHIMFGHAYKGQPAGQVLLKRFKAGGGTLYDLEYLVDEDGRRVAAFGYWAGYAGAAVSLKCWAAQQRGGICRAGARNAPARRRCWPIWRPSLAGLPRPRAIIIGALGRVGTGAADLCAAMGVAVTKWDMAETASGGPFPEVLAARDLPELHPRPPRLPGVRAGLRPRPIRAS